MDAVKAKEWEEKFRDQSIGGWTTISLIDNGKSAAVFKAVGENPSELVALKIFDDELIQRYGDETQLKRIQRELELVGKHHPNMVRILDGGFHAESGNHYIVMEYLDGPSLSDCLTKIPEANIPSLVEQLVSACEFLEALGFAHRDIKPANIVLLEDMSRLVLLDFGVLKPVGEVGLTDVEGQRLFVGTLQYSSPEFLLREEDDNIEGWRALAIYQVGAVLHDLIMRRPIFSEFVTPYAALVNAVQHEHPNISSEIVPPYLIDACQMALVKDPEKRLELVKWDAFRPPIMSSTADAARKRIGQRLQLADARLEEIVDDGPATAALMENVVDWLKIELRRIRLEHSNIMPPLVVTRNTSRGEVLTVRMGASAHFHLARDVCMEIDVKIVDLETQAVRLNARAWVSLDADVPMGSFVSIFKGPYNSGATSGRVEAAALVTLDQAQNGTVGELSLAVLGVD